MKFSVLIYTVELSVKTISQNFHSDGNIVVVFRAYIKGVLLFDVTQKWCSYTWSKTIKTPTEMHSFVVKTK